MTITRPDLTKLDPEIQAYIARLEEEIELLQRNRRPERNVRSDETSEDMISLAETNEPPTPINIISGTAGWVVKRTPRHLYARQRRSGMGIFDLDTTIEDSAGLIATADENQVLLLLTNQARVFRCPASTLSESPVRSKGMNLAGRFNLEDGEKLVAILPELAQGYLTSVSQKGYIRVLRHHVFGDYMKPGMVLFDPRIHGPLVGACWSPGDGDLFLATQQGKAIRFAEKLVPPGGVQGIRLETADACVAVCAVNQESNVFLLGEDGKGTIRTMENFSANKAPGAGGKQAMHTARLVGACSIEDEDDLFILTQLSKIIRFNAGEVPIKDGAVQGVVCISLRGDFPVGITTGLSQR